MCFTAATSSEALDIRPTASLGTSCILSQAIADEHVPHATGAQNTGADAPMASNSPSKATESTLVPRSIPSRLLALDEGGKLVMSVALLPQGAPPGRESIPGGRRTG